MVHDLSLARAYGTDAVLLQKGRPIMSGSIADAFDPETLNSVYAMDVGGWMRRMLSQWE